jgi:hypothetical protein
MIASEGPTSAPKPDGQPAIHWRAHRASMSQSDSGRVTPESTNDEAGVGWLHPSAHKVADALMVKGARGPFREFAQSTKTSADTAPALECEVGAIACCLVFVLDDEPIVVIKGGALRVDTKKFASGVGGVPDARPPRTRSARRPVRLLGASPRSIGLVRCESSSANPGGLRTDLVGLRHPQCRVRDDLRGADATDQRATGQPARSRRGAGAKGRPSTAQR